MKCCQVAMYNNLNYIYCIIYIFLGMLSKSRSHVFCVAAVFHVLFCIDEAYACEQVKSSAEDEVSEKAIEAAITFVWYLCQQTAYIASKMALTDEKNKFAYGMYNSLFLILERY